MKKLIKILVFIGFMSVSFERMEAQIVNAIAYYPSNRGVCGQSMFTPTDSLYTAALSGGLILPYKFIWEQSLDGVNYTAIGGAAAAKEDYKPGTISVNTWFRRTVVSGIDTSHSNSYEFYSIPYPISGNVITPTKSTTIPCGTTSYSPGLINGSIPPTLMGGINGNYGFSWFVSTDGINYSQIAFASTYQYTPTVITKSTWYKRLVFSPNKICIDSSNVVAFQFGALAGNSITPPAITSACNASSFTPTQINGSNPGTGTTFQWQSGPDSLHYTDITGVVSQNYTPPPISTTTYYRRMATLGGCSGYSNSVFFSVSPPFSANTIMSSQTIDSAATPTAFTGNLVTSGVNTLTYSWEQSTDSTNFVPATGSNQGQNYQAASLVQKTYFRRKALTGACFTYSNVIVITVKKSSVIIPPPPPVTCPNGVNSANLGVKIFNRPNTKPTGSQYDYSIAVTNFGPNTATSVVILDTIPSILDYIGNSATTGTVNYDSKTRILTWSITSLPVGAQEGLILTVNPTVNDRIINSVTVSGKECDPLLSNNRSIDTLNDPIPVLLAKDIPDIITPNGDGFNDTFVISNFLGVKALSDNHLLIFDRWGNPVYHTKGYQNDWAGKGLSSGTYFYVLRINNGARSQNFKGYITLIK